MKNPSGNIDNGGLPVFKSREYPDFICDITPPLLVVYAYGPYIGLPS